MQLIERFGEEFLQQLKSGKDPKIEEFAKRIPERKNEIKDFLAALTFVDRCKAELDELDDWLDRRWSHRDRKQSLKKHTKSYSNCPRNAKSCY